MNDLQANTERLFDQQAAGLKAEADKLANHIARPACHVFDKCTRIIESYGNFCVTVENIRKQIHEAGQWRNEVQNEGTADETAGES